MHSEKPSSRQVLRQRYACGVMQRRVFFMNFPTGPSMNRRTLLTLLFPGLLLTSALVSAAPEARSKIGNAPLNQPKPFVVVIDAGHGGKDSGAQGVRGTQEKEVVLAVAIKLAALIHKQPGMRRVMVRNDDRFVGLRRRAQIAREAHADLFISLHADAFEDPDAQGSSVFILSDSGASSEAAKWLADRENAREVGGVDLAAQDAMVASVLLDLSKNANNEASEQAAESVLQSLQKEFKIHSGGVQKAGFAVLKSLDVPSMLIEMAFISNASEEARLLDPKQQDRMAKAIFRGIVGIAPRISGTPTP